MKKRHIVLSSILGIATSLGTITLDAQAVNLFADTQGDLKLIQAMHKSNVPILQRVINSMNSEGTTERLYIRRFDTGYGPVYSLYRGKESSENLLGEIYVFLTWDREKNKLSRDDYEFINRKRGNNRSFVQMNTGDFSLITSGAFNYERGSDGNMRVSKPRYGIKVIE